MSRPAPPRPASAVVRSTPKLAAGTQATPAVANVSVTLRAQLDCQSCFEPFSTVVGPRYPRIFAPCAHTFCTECISNQLKARGPNDFRCLTHNQSIAISKAEDVKANFALIELLELIEKDADHQGVDERTKPPSCSECDAASVWYCKNDDACYCDAHKLFEHSSKSRSNHIIMPVAERAATIVPKCTTHKSKDMELWCTQCSVLCCMMCERSGTHRQHPSELVPVDDVVITQRVAVQNMAKEANELTADRLDPEAQSLIKLQADFEASARRVQEEITKQEAEMMRAVEARFTALRKEAQVHLANGLKHISNRVDDLTMNRSRAAMVSEEAARVLRMSDYALLVHTASVEQNLARARKGWEEYQLNLLVPQMMELRSAPKLLLEEIAVAGLVHLPWKQIDQGKLAAVVEPLLPLSSHRAAEFDSVQRLRSQTLTSLKDLFKVCQCQYCYHPFPGPAAVCHERYGGQHAWSAFYVQPQQFVQLFESLAEK